MFSNVMKFLGFYGDDDYDDDDDLDEMPQPKNKFKNKKQGAKSNSRPGANDSGSGNVGLVMFKGVPSEDIKYQLRDALRNGTMLLLDLSELSDRELSEGGSAFITFMRGVAFASGGRMDNIGREQYLVSPLDGMFEDWVENGQAEVM
ncbi:MAG: cell division protein SepF [Synergistaceae bacterium]|nr:cell division protein SepF [Synergistaceae bacterium]